MQIFSTEQDYARAQRAASFLHLEIQGAEKRPTGCSGPFLWAGGGRLELGVADDGPTAWADLNKVKTILKSGKTSHLARSIGIDKYPDLKVLDAMAGFGMDAMFMLGMHCRVQMLENAPIMYVMLRDALERFAALTGKNPCELMFADAHCWLGEAERHFDVVYLDPMFPVRNKKALPNRRAQILAQMIDSVESEQSLLQLITQARQCASKRVVLKRRRIDPEVIRPDWQVSGRSIRYDVYRGLQEA